MSHSNKYGSTLVVHQDSRREASVGSWASRSSCKSPSYASSESSYRSGVREERLRDPSADDHYVDVKERSHKGGKSVVVVNHHKTSKKTKEPTPGYHHASTYGGSSQRAA